VYLGNQVKETTGYNTALQVNSIAVTKGSQNLLRLVLNYGTDANNRNVRSQQISFNAPAAFSATPAYGYDGSNRLKTLLEGASIRQTYVYDFLGNRAVLQGDDQYLPASDLIPQVSADTPAAAADKYSSNQWKVGGDANTSHDAAGNQIVLPARTTSYDEANRLLTRTVRVQTARRRNALRRSGPKVMGLDYFGARYYSGAQGRFTSVDPLMTSATVYDPQTWNRYTYGRNNPLKFIDPNGMQEISAENCAKDPQCVTVKLNVVLDKKADLYDRKGNLRPEYQKKLDQQIAAAKDEYGTSKISFDVSYSQGSLSNTGVTGAVAGAINVVVSDNVPGPYGLSSAGTGRSTDANGIAFTFLNMNQSDSGTLAHEFSHHFLGDTRSSVMSAFNALLLGVMNAFTDLHHDYQRSFYSIFGPYVGNRFDPPAGQSLPVTSPFNQGAKLYQVPPIQEAMRPRQ